jgi:hypothetical protein
MRFSPPSFLPLFAALITCVCGCVSRIERTGSELPRYQAIDGSTLIVASDVFVLSQGRDRILYPPKDAQVTPYEIGDFTGHPLRSGFGDNVFVTGVVKEGTVLEVVRIIEINHPELGRYHKIWARVTGDGREPLVRIEFLMKDFGIIVFDHQPLMPDGLYLQFADENEH